MSMISAQIDELRELAGDGSMEWVAGPVRVSVLRDAADTIWKLRDDLQRANADNAKLRELVRDMLVYEMMSEYFLLGDGKWPTETLREFMGRARELGVEVTS